MSRWPQVTIPQGGSKPPRDLTCLLEESEEGGPWFDLFGQFLKHRDQVSLRCSWLFYLLFVEIVGHTIKIIIKTDFPFPRLILTMGSGSVFKQGKQNLCMKNLDLSRRNRGRSWWTYCSRSLLLTLCLMHPSLFYLPIRYHTQITHLMIRFCEVPTWLTRCWERSWQTDYQSLDWNPLRPRWIVNSEHLSSKFCKKNWFLLESFIRWLALLRTFGQRGTIQSFGRVWILLSRPLWQTNPSPPSVKCSSQS